MPFSLFTVEILIESVLLSLAFLHIQFRELALQIGMAVCISL
jgi:hypothetical protein